MNIKNHLKVFMEQLKMCIWKYNTSNKQNKQNMQNKYI